MTGRSTTTMTIRLSPELKADFGRIARAKGSSINNEFVTYARSVVVSERVKEGVK